MDTFDQLYEQYSSCDNPHLLLILPKISGSLSIAGSTYIITAVLKKWRTEKKSINPYHRIMAAYSVYDIIFTFFNYFLGTWMVPAETGWFGAVGTTVTCSIQGFSYAFAGTACLVRWRWSPLHIILLNVLRLTSNVTVQILSRLPLPSIFVSSNDAISFI